MSEITDVILILAEDSNNIKSINEFLIENRHHPLASIYDIALPDNWHGGEKRMTGNIYLGAFNYLDVEAFAKFIQSIDFKEPAIVQLFIWEEGDYRFREVDLFPQRRQKADNEEGFPKRKGFYITEQSVAPDRRG